MNGKDIMLSIASVMLEEKKRAYMNLDFFYEYKTVIFMSEKAFMMVEKELQHIANCYVTSNNHRMFGCKVKIISDEGIRVYIGKELTIFKEGAEE